MKCKQFLLLVSDYIDGTLSPIECDEVEQHLRECNNCRNFLNTLKATLSLCQPSYDVPVAVHQTLHRVLREQWEICKIKINVGVPKFPLAEIIESKNKINISIVLPGVSKEEITLIVGDDYIEISGVAKKIEGIYYLDEIKGGTFSRKLRLPSAVNPSKAQAYLELGILKVTLPKEV